MRMPKLNYDQTPFLVIWETTQACNLACLHCRASAQPLRDPRELTSKDAEKLLEQASAMGTPIFVLSGGDPLKREDLYHLIKHGASLGLRMATIPAATDLLTEDVVVRLKNAGLSQMALSLDFPDAVRHDAFRGVPGAFDRTMRAVQWAHRHRLPLQINTTLCAESAPCLDEMVELIRALDIVFWEVFFLVPIGRGATLQGLSASRCEEIFETLYQVQKNEKFIVKVTEAPHFRRYAVQREAAHGHAPHHESHHELPPQLVRTEGPGQTIGLATQGVNAGNGFLFVSHTGDVFPSGFLPVSAGNVRERDLATLYRDSDIFRALRRPGELRGVCGYCEFNEICGGSRSRAYALTGDYLASDPWCAYKPPRVAQRPAAPAV